MRTNLDNNVPAVEMEYKLPSAGLPYLRQCPQFPETVKIRPYTLETEGYLMGNGTMHDKMAFVTGKVAALPGIDAGDLYLADQFMILAIARALTYGETYSFRSQCPSCGYVETANIRVPEALPVKVWSRTAPPKLEVRLPCGDTVGLKFMTVAEDGAVNKYVREMLSRSAGAGASEAPIGYMRRMAYHLASVNGDVPRTIAEADQYVVRLVGSDMIAYQDAIDEQGCGIQYDWWITCDKCQFVYERSIPIVGDFFRRNRGRRTDAQPGTPPPPRDPPKDAVAVERAG